MFRFVVLDLPQLAAMSAFIALGVVLFMLYRDMRLLLQMLIEIKEEFMISRMECHDKESNVRSVESKEVQVQPQSSGDIDTTSQESGESAKTP